METIRGVVERVTYRNPENGFTVFRIRMDGKETARIIGSGSEVIEGEVVAAEGSWVEDPVRGRQFQAVRFASSPPVGRVAVESFLASGVVKGVGPHLASKLFAKFGDRVFDVIERQPEKLRSVQGIGKAKAQSIEESWKTQKGSRDLMLFLHEHGVTPARAARIHKQYGNDAMRLIRENPYRLADEVRGIGFVIADALALRLGLARDSIERLRAGVRWVLEKQVTTGHCAYPTDLLIKESVELLGAEAPLVEGAIALEIEARRLIAEPIEGRVCIFPSYLREAEAAAAKRLRRLAAASVRWKIQTEKAIHWVEPRLAIQLSPTQREAIARSLDSRVSIITGGPGVGKTTIVRAVVEIVAAKKLEIELAAPTGRAAKRMGEATGHPARTIHRLLEVDPMSGNFQRNELAPLSCDLLIIDEASMVDVPLLDAVLRALPENAALLLIGDADQLPSVGPGQVLSDLIASKTIPVSELREIHRQAAGSRIVVNAHRVNQGESPLSGDIDQSSDFFIVEASSGQEAKEKIVRMVAERIPARFGLDPRADIQVLAPMHRGDGGVQSLNAALQQRLNPGAAGSARIERGDSILAPGDKVMQTANDYDRDIFNGDLGVVRSVDVKTKRLRIDFDGRMVEAAAADLEAITLAWATTIHKSQGSEYPAVVISLLREHSIMLQRNLLYTAITRGRRLVVLVGDKRAIAMAVRNAESRRRFSRLKERLTEA